MIRIYRYGWSFCVFAAVFTLITVMLVTTASVDAVIATLCGLAAGTLLSISLYVYLTESGS